MTLQQRPYKGQSDWQLIAELIQADPHYHHRYDFPWRLCSTSLEDQKNAMLWQDEQGRLQVFAGLQFPWLTLDYAIRPAIRTWEVETEVIHWAEARLHQIAAETNNHFPFNISAFIEEHERIRFLEAQGYTRWEPHMVVLTRPLTNMPDSKIPQGFMIRPLNGEAEVKQYAELQRKAFESENMTTRWRSQTLNAPLYNPNLDLVAVAPDGRLAGFCIFWYQPALKTAQIEPLGVHPDFQNLGLSQALMAEGFGRAANEGAETIQVETYSFSQPALKAYEAAGFEQLTQKLLFYKAY